MRGRRRKRRKRRTGILELRRVKGRVVLHVHATDEKKSVRGGERGDEVYTPDLGENNESLARNLQLFDGFSDDFLAISVGIDVRGIPRIYPKLPGVSRGVTGRTGRQQRRKIEFSRGKTHLVRQLEVLDALLLLEDPVRPSLVAVGHASEDNLRKRASCERFLQKEVEKTASRTLETFNPFFPRRAYPT
jgi:hypothetical protein